MKKHRILTLSTLPSLLTLIAASTVAQAATSTTSMPLVKQGDSGSEVVTLQKDLTTAGYSVHASGKFDTATLTQVKKFQQTEKVASDGIVGPATWSALLLADSAKSAVKTAATQTPKYTISVNGKTVSQPSGFVQGGTTYFSLWYIKTALDGVGLSSTWEQNVWAIKSGPYSSNAITIPSGSGNTTIAVDGRTVTKFNSIVRNDPSTGKPSTYVPLWNVEQLLLKMGIKNTWNGTTWAVTATPKPVTAPSGSNSAPTITRILETGVTGTDVASLQSMLSKLGFQATDPSGMFGTGTEWAVKAFQKWNSLTVDGQVGPQTWSSLQSAVLKPKTMGTPIHYGLQAFGERVIEANGTPSGIYGFAVNNDTYLPLYYIITTLKTIGITVNWNGTTCSIAAPSNVTVTPKALASGSGSTPITLNGVKIVSANRIVAFDPQGGSQTSYLPATYFLQALSQLGIVSTWDGHTWNMTLPPNWNSGTQGGLGGNPGGSGGNPGGSGGNPGGSGGNPGGSGGNPGGSGGNGGTPTPPPPSFTTVDLRYAAPGDLTPASIDAFLKANGSPFYGLGASYEDAQNTYGVDANYLVSHSLEECSWHGSQIYWSKNNMYGYGAFDSSPGADAGMFPSSDYAIHYQAWTVRNNYLNPGASYYAGPTLVGMNQNYATDPNWNANIAGLMGELATSVGDSSSDYTQFTSPTGAPAPKSTAEPVFYMNGATATVSSDSVYGGLPYYSSMGTGMTDMFWGTLSNGSDNSNVYKLQGLLNSVDNANLTVDGNFGPMTEAAVKQFQANHGMTQTGTWTLANWNQYNYSEPNLIASGKTVQVDEAMQGIADGLVMMWYHIPGYGWVDSQYVHMTNIYRAEVPSSLQATSQTVIPLVGSPDPRVQSVHSGDWVVSVNPQPSGGYYTVEVMDQQTDQPITAKISTSVATLVQQQ